MDDRRCSNMRRLCHFSRYCGMVVTRLATKGAMHGNVSVRCVSCHYAVATRRILPVPGREVIGLLIFIWSC